MPKGVVEDSPSGPVSFNKRWLHSNNKGWWNSSPLPPGFRICGNDGGQFLMPGGAPRKKGTPYAPPYT